jgi:hypothetical protein
MLGEAEVVLRRKGCAKGEGNTKGEGGRERERDKERETHQGGGRQRAVERASNMDGHGYWDR